MQYAVRATPAGKASMLLGGAAMRAKRRGILMVSGAARKEMLADITRRLERGVCECCGQLLDMSPPTPGGKRRSRPLSPSIERVVPSLGYTLGNVAVWCMTCNMAKGDKPLAEFDEWLARAYHFRLRKGYP